MARPHPGICLLLLCEPKRLLQRPQCGLGILAVLLAIQLSVPGLYLPPVFKRLKLKVSPPQTIIWLPVHTAV